jgi:hypothetical protein
MFPNSKKRSRQEDYYGLQALTPVYGQVIQSAPTWSGPFQAPTLETMKQPVKQSAASFWGGTAANLASTAACAALTETGIGMLACPILGQSIGNWMSNLIQPPAGNDRTDLYGAPARATN